MAVITISREFGSAGDAVARQVAQTLGYHFVDQEFIGAILSEYGFVEFDTEYESKPSFWEKFDAERGKHRDQMVAMLDQVVRAVAQHGNVVILGRSGFAILAGFADVLHVRFQAPFSTRVAQVMAQQNISAESAEAVVKERDRVRLGFVEEFYRVPWGEISAFDLVVDTSKIGPDLAAGWVVAATKALNTNPEVVKPTTGLIEVDPILAAAVSERLKCQKVHRQ